MRAFDSAEGSHLFWPECLENKCLENKIKLWPVVFSSVTHALCFEIRPAGLQSARRISTRLLLTMYSSSESNEPAVTYTQWSPFMEAKNTLINCCMLWIKKHAMLQKHLDNGVSLWLLYPVWYFTYEVIPLQLHPPRPPSQIKVPCTQLHIKSHMCTHTDTRYTDTNKHIHKTQTCTERERKSDRQRERERVSKG